MTDPIPHEPEDDAEREDVATTAVAGPPSLLDDPTGPDAHAEWDDDEEPEELPRRPHRRLVTPVTAGLAAVLLLAVGFIGGVEVQKGQGDDSGGGAAGAPAGLRAAFAGGQGAPGGGSGQAGGAGQASGGGSVPTAGTVASKDGSTLYVAGADGATVKVKTNGNSKVTRTADSAVGDVQPGDTVVVQGTTNSNGTVTATQITATAKGVTAGGFGGGFGGGGGFRSGGFSGGGSGRSGGGGTGGASGGSGSGG